MTDEIEDWGDCAWCGEKYRADIATYSYWSPDRRGDGLEFCSDLCRELHKSEPRYTITEAGKAALEGKK